MTDPALGLLMLGLIVVAIMMGFPTAFTLMGMGMFFGVIAFWDPSAGWLHNKAFDLMVQRTYGVMTNDVLLSIPLFVFMGYVIERAALVDKMFHSVQLAFRRLPASLAVTTLLVCAFWGIASGIVGAVVVLMGVIALRPMLAAGYDVRLASGVITAGGTLGILIPPSVMLIVYAAVAGQSIVKLYAAAMIPGLFLTVLYLVYIVGWALIDPKVAPKLPADKYTVAVPAWLSALERGPKRRVLGGVAAALFSPGRAGIRFGTALQSAVVAVIPLLLTVLMFGAAYWYVTVYSAPKAASTVDAPQAMGDAARDAPERADSNAAAQAAAKSDAGGLQEPPKDGDDGKSDGKTAKEEAPQALGEAADLNAKPGANVGANVGANAGPSAGPDAAKEGAEPASINTVAETVAGSTLGKVPESFYFWFWGCALVSGLLLLFYYLRMDGEQLEILRLLEESVVPLAVLTFIVLAVILFGITTATESAAVGALGAMYLAALAKYLRRALWATLAGAIIGLALGALRGDFMTLLVSGCLGALALGTAVPWISDILGAKKLTLSLRESTFLTAKTTAMVCWLFLGSALFSAVFALHGGQGLIERWVLSMNLTPLEFMIVAQLIIFVLGWPLEWTEIIVIFVPIFIPLLAHFQVDPLLFGTMVAVNLQAAFLSPPVAMSAFYLKGVAPKHVTLNQIFAGMMPYMLIVLLCLACMYIWPGMTLWLPNFLYGN